MRICTILLLLAALLFSGCQAQNAMETVTDEPALQVSASMMQAVYVLPQEASLAVMGSQDGGSVYLCDGYTVTVQTLPGGDLDETLRKTTGFSARELTLMETTQDGYDQVQCAWSAASEEGEQVGRLKLLSDGAYHYVITCVAPARDAQQMLPVWQDLFGSFRLVSPEEDLYTGS